mmetsp:Transcript_81551/g.143801  ORF Transcript_81551/g.143801 Transcript_81551/m.143801 type:complete len:250 (-) Transcript_81551:1276-2025(-)
MVSITALPTSADTSHLLPTATSRSQCCRAAPTNRSWSFSFRFSSIWASSCACTESACACCSSSSSPKAASMTSQRSVCAVLLAIRACEKASATAAASTCRCSIWGDRVFMESCRLSQSALQFAFSCSRVAIVSCTVSRACSLRASTEDRDRRSVSLACRISSFSLMISRRRRCRSMQRIVSFSTAGTDPLSSHLALMAMDCWMRDSMLALRASASANAVPRLWEVKIWRKCSIRSVRVRTLDSLAMSCS